MKGNPKPAATPPASSDSTTRVPAADHVQVVAHCHLRFGWWALLIFLTGGIALEAMHGFKVGLYLDVSNSTRRLMWTLAHAHGTLLGLVNIAFAASVPLLGHWPERTRRVASVCLRTATVLLPGGFFAGGLVIYSGDPGLGIMLVPAGALLLFLAVFLTARATATR